MRVDMRTETGIGRMDHALDISDAKSFGLHTIFRDDLNQWWWAISSAAPNVQIVATGPAQSKQDAERRGNVFLKAAKTLLADA